MRIGRWTSLFATVFLLAYPGQEFFTGAWRDLRNRRLGMDVPIALGLGIAFLGSVYTTVTQIGEVYYDSIAMFIFLVLLARRIELRGRVRATDALDRVGKILPRVALRLESDGEREVLVTDLAPGDRIRVAPGEIVPTDGRLAAGLSTFDESLLTGEPLPVPHAAGEAVIGGSCNIDQTVVVEVSHSTTDSTVAEIHRLLTNGMRDAPRYAVLAQRAAAWFVGAVLLIALVTACVWLWIDPIHALPNTVAVLIVTCPCAFALATPVAAAIAVGRLADNGLLTVRSDALEVLAECDTIAFDKTGTLTTGELEVVAIEPFGDLDPDQALATAAALEHASEHPIGRSLRQANTLPTRPAADLHNHVGRGIEGSIDASVWRIGKPDFALRDTLRSRLGERLTHHLNAGTLVVALSDGHDQGALFVLSDRRRAGAELLTSDLRRQGVRELALLSGDDSSSVRQFARDLDFDVVFGDMTPSDKLNWIRDRQAAGQRVAMVGDGINDAPTLAAADVSVSFAHATDLAQVNSGLLVLGSDLAMLPRSRQLAEKTRRVIRQNLLWAASYNFLAVPAAAVGLIAPWGAAIGMSLSSLLVVINALRLRRS